MDSTPIILHMIDELKMGGAQTHLNTLLREWLRRPQFRHIVVSLFGDGVVGDSIRESGIEVLVLDLSGAVTAGRFWFAQDQIYQLIRKYNPQIVESHLTYSRLLGLFAAWRARVPTRIGFEQGDIYFNSWKWRMANFMGQVFAHKIIVCSHALGKWVHQTHKVFWSRLEVVYNCVDPLAFRKSANPLISRRELEISDESFVFCAVGTLGKGVNKRMDICIQALAALPKEFLDSYILICGDGPQRAELEKLAMNLTISNRVKFLGLRKDVPDVMGISDAFCHAAPFEPFGIVCIEAMLMELPVIIPDAGGITEIVDRDRTGLKYEVLNSPDLMKQMECLIGDREKAKAIGRRGQQMVLEKMTVEKCLAKLKQIYKIS